MSQETVKIGVYVPGDSQLLDLACIDILAIMSREYLSVIGMPAHVIAAAPSVRIHYITTAAQKAANAVPLTASLTMVPTCDTTDGAVQPGQLDILFVPGPDPNSIFDDDALAFLRAHAETPTADILSVCTGIFVCGQAGILKGRKACGPRDLQSLIHSKFSDVELLGDTHRWIQDGNLWSSGGITNGNDMVAAYARASKHFPAPIVEIACKIADVGDRGQLFN